MTLNQHSSIKTYTKESLIEHLLKIKEMGWIRNARPGNQGGIGNTIEDLLGIEENNLPIPNAAEWELKCQRLKSNSLTTLFHMEPSPTAVRFVPRILLPLYGWEHQQAGKKYPPSELSFRQTISNKQHTDRGFSISIKNDENKLTVSFDSNFVTEKHHLWLKTVEKRVGNLSELNPQPYWGFDDLYHKAGTKLHNCFFIGAETKKEKGKEFFKYTKIMMLQQFSKEKFIAAIDAGLVYVDFDARTGHNHGTKFRFKNNCLPELYDITKEIS